MKIRSKLFVVIMINFLLIIGVVSVVYVNVKSIQTSFEDVAGTTTPAIIHLHSMNEGFFEAAYSALSYALTRDDKDRAKFDAGIQSFNTHKEELITLVKGGNTVAPEEDQELIGRLNAAEDKFVTASQRLFEHVARDGMLFIGHDEGMLAEDFEQIKNLGATISLVQVPLQEWLEMEKEEVLEAQEGVEGAVGQTLLIVFGLGVFMVLAIVLTDGFMAYRISRPLASLETTARTISQGDLSAHVDIKTKDEFGKLATTFNEMTDKLRQSQSVLEEQVKARTQELETIKGSLEEKVKERTTELEALKSGLEKTVGERTEDLKTKMSELERMNQMMTGRELKMVEMKKELEKMREHLATLEGQPAPPVETQVKTRKKRVIIETPESPETATPSSLVE